MLRFLHQAAQAAPTKLLHCFAEAIYALVKTSDGEVPSLRSHMTLTTCFWASLLPCCVRVGPPAEGVCAGGDGHLLRLAASSFALLSRGAALCSRPSPADSLPGRRSSSDPRIAVLHREVRSGAVKCGSPASGFVPPRAATVRRKKSMEVSASWSSRRFCAFQTTPPSGR